MDGSAQKKLATRVKRIAGQVAGIERMLEDRRYCVDILNQIAAVRSALNSVGRVILEDHLQSCMVEAVEKDDYQRALKDLKNSLDKFIG